MGKKRETVREGEKDKDKDKKRKWTKWERVSEWAMAREEGRKNREREGEVCKSGKRGRGKIIHKSQGNILCKKTVAMIEHIHSLARNTKVTLQHAT